MSKARIPTTCVQKTEVESKDIAIGIWKWVLGIIPALKCSDVIVLWLFYMGVWFIWGLLTYSIKMSLEKCKHSKPRV